MKHTITNILLKSAPLATHNKLSFFFGSGEQSVVPQKLQTRKFQLKCFNTLLSPHVQK